MAKRYYWLKLSSDFFDDETINFIEEQENGVEYVNFYLKLCLKSLKSNGSLIRLIGERYIPYDVKSLSRLTGVNQDTVRVALALFEKIGLVKFLDSGELYLTQINEMVGSETDKAKLMRKKRAKEKGELLEESNNVTTDSNVVTEVLPECYIESESRVKSQDEDKNIDFDKRYKIKDKTANAYFVTKYLLDELLIKEDEFEGFDGVLVEFSSEYEAVDIKVKSKYVLEKMKDKNIRDRLAYFSKAMKRNLDEDYETKKVDNSSVNHEELDNFLKKFE